MSISKTFDLRRALPSKWDAFLKEEFKKPYFSELHRIINYEYENYEIYPPKSLIFNAFEYCSPEDIKVVIIGQDPYHGKGQANGLCFSVQEGVKIPPSLRNIYKELFKETGKGISSNGNLEPWAIQGVLMLNSILTVRKSEPGAHKAAGWEIFTEAVVKKLSKSFKQLVFILWGKYAQKKELLINSDKHLILKSAHPSPFSAYRGFFGNNHFIETNNYLRTTDQDIINW
ncbi:MAG: uracil-DNA glycosylase [Bacteroidota bacterium]|nr:uracil-DNA glycosylase [Bacteroidota bacterium]